MEDVNEQQIVGVASSVALSKMGVADGLVCPQTPKIGTLLAILTRD